MKKHLLACALIITSYLGFGQATHNVTFQVDINQYGGTFTTPEVNGDFNGWCGNCNQLTDPNNDGIWETTLQITADSIEWKFAHDNWAGQENLNPNLPCVKTTSGFTNRFAVLTGDTTFPIVCWESCDSCGTPPDTNMVTFQVDMTQYGGTFTTPEVNGDFNGWCGGCNTLADPDMDGIWTTVLPITADSIEWKFAHDAWAGQENLNPNLPCVKTTSGFTNRFTHLNGDTIIPIVCWEDCMACGSTPDTAMITFRVDMNNYGGTFTTPEVNGDFNGWCGGCNGMTDVDNDGVWEATLPITADSIEFKYAYDAWTGQENFMGGEPCTKTTSGFTNRFMYITGDSILPIVCYDSCGPCSGGGGGGGGTPDTAMVTFQVDMSQYGGSYTTPELNGDFAGWCGNCIPMTDANNDDIWEVTVALWQDSIEFKFSYDNWAGQENLTPGDPCTKTTSGFTNRFEYINGDTTFSVVCWESCMACASTPPDTSMVTFQVDMNDYTGSFMVPEVNGSFNGWCGNCNPLTDANNDGIWETTIALTGDSIEYKFSYDNWSGQEELTDGDPCTFTTIATPDTFINRLIPMLNGDTTLPAVCWESCDECPVGLWEFATVNDITVFPNPANETITLSTSQQLTGNEEVTIVNSLGQVVLNIRGGAAVNRPINIAELENGFYIILLNSEAGLSKSKFLKSR